ncbi:GL18979 [Drosophila persimilis]|uniref:RNA-binding protein Rsf1 n=4 Tax=obscura group TaxID=32355 RepID=Q29CX5_DROPS|nr:RNA-binding protein Rsf1 [Drosophila pseudoobscura]XP_002014389.1 RNA-binding protein Rsf1 [Drosophila persimilis]XP_017151062.1 RNA-binding protein Rsf1 [Drosophila miranda]XP_034129702.1 RNA-binding protein Rsf1 [Drosophila guanche]XP_034669595.1 RNA-binding protein Rsf1 [Drosophila subobscura]EDW28385.1 GL18979 [Drosophila persimilis]SPP81631.1 blast:RNA-binding protein Rsf1 [Drosophila guanche]
MTSMTDQRGTRVYVGNLTDKVKKDDLEGEFTKYGKLNSVWIAFNPPGFAFVEFEHRDDAEKACDILNGSELLGSQLRVEISKGRPRQSRRGGSSERGRRGDFGRHSINSSNGGFRQVRGSSGSSSRHAERGYSSGRSGAGYSGRDSGSNGFSRRDVYGGGRDGSRYSSGNSTSYGRSGGQGGCRFRSRSPVGNHRF